MFRRNLGAYGIAGLTVAGTATLGSLYTQQSVGTSWYSEIKPSFAPPSWVFPIVWTTLYLLLAVAFAQSIVGDPALLTILHVANLALNVIWCRTFFGERNPERAFGILVGNLGVAVGIAGLTQVALVRFLMIPYIAWLVFATALNGAAFLTIP
jgi:benzodiazapine receptor